MRHSTSSLLAISLFTLTFATPTPVDLAPRCGQTVFPTFLQTLTEAQPDLVHPNSLSSTGTFQVAQIVTKGQVSNRIYQLVAFEGIPAGAYACQLNVKFPSPYTITSVGNPTLNVTTLFNGLPDRITYPNDYSWKKFNPPASPPLGSGLFGTVNLSVGQQTAINSEACAEKLAFVFEIASWISETASVEFVEYINQLNGAGLAGVYLTHSC